MPENQDYRGDKLAAHSVYVFSKAKDGSTKLSANFSVSEFACKDGSDPIVIDPKLVAALQLIRDHYQKPLRLLSAYRTVTYNQRVGGAANSQHCLGKAADIDCSSLGVTPNQLAAYVETIAETMGIGGIGVYATFVHIDTRADRKRWKG